MSLGLGIFLLVVGGVLAFGVRDQFSALDLTAIGYVCMAGGVLAIILTLVLQQQRRRTSNATYVERRDDPRPPV
ncbi:hypothetical protein GCM10009616_03810 [Microlunatus lacustris]